MQEFGKLLMMAGAFLVLVGLWLWSGWGRSWIGRLPGDIHVTRENYSFHFPLLTCLLVSVCLSLLFWLLKKLK